MNGYFEIIAKEDGTYARLHPSKDNGKSITFEEVVTYLNDRRLIDYDATALQQSIKHLTEITDIKVFEGIINSIDEIIEIKTTPDKMYAFAKFYPPSGSGKRLTKSDILEKLMNADIKYGIFNEVIDSLVTKKDYCIEYLIAKGVPPVEGKDASITYNFNLDQKAKPKENVDGTVDFHKLDIISHVSKGELLATLVPEEAGTSGFDVTGKEIRPPSVKKQALKYGKNVTMSEDGSKLFASTDGHVKLDNNKVEVSNVFEVQADVDSSTGDIEYEGNVIVRGNVRTNFTIRAKGDIEVNGVVEGAILIADGQIILRRGIQGMNRGVLEAKGNIIAKFIENSTVKSGGYIETEAILHSNVAAKGEVIVAGKKGLITGGEVRSGCEVSAKTIGSHMGTSTHIEVGIDPEVVDNYNRINAEIKDTREEIVKMEQVINLLQRRQSQEALTQERMKQLQNATRNKILLESKIKDYYVELEAVCENLDKSNFGKVKIYNIGYPGVRIVIGNVKYYVREEIKYCQLHRDGADIKLTNYA